MATVIPVGQAINFAGSTEIMTLDSLRNTIANNSWPPSSHMSPITDLSPTLAWRLGYADTWASGNGLLYWAELNGEACAMADNDARLALGSNPWSVNAAGNVVGTVRKLTAAEKASMTGQAALANCTLLGVAAVTFPAGIIPPFYVSMTAKMPHFKGMWPALWLLSTSRAWPPEIDAAELYSDDGGAIVDTTSIHSLTSGWTNLITPPAAYMVSNNTASDYLAAPTGKGFNTDFITYGAVVYPDGIWTTRDDKCVRPWPCPSDCRTTRFYVLIDLTARGGTDPNEALGSIEISAFSVRAMPAVYGSGVVPTPPPPPPPPPPGPTPSPSGTVITPGVGTFTDAAGHVYSIDAGKNAIEDAKPIPGGDGTSQMEWYNGIVYGEDALHPGSWYQWTQTSWVAIAAPPAPTPTPPPPPPPLPSVTITGANFALAQAAFTKMQGDVGGLPFSTRKTDLLAQLAVQKSALGFK